ncbi:hypothetical protein ABZT04_41145 [Streptomyces sp. NPDC005492]|uniref:hypothetical protein n=1 Tax=Streptomyces sp. NPDC005492 TaxID=3156883 RepID=UPI0033BBF131
MDTLTKLNIFGLALSAVFLAMACVKADRVRAWRADFNPSAPDVPNSAFTLARLLFVTIAGIGIYTSVQGFGVSDDMSWSDDELTSAVRGATDDLDGYRYQADESGAPLYFDDYASLIEQKVTENGGGDAPETGVATEPSDPDTESDTHITVTANGTDKVFCVHVVRTRSKEDDYTPPGIAGREGTLTFSGYRLAVAMREGAC